MENALGAESTSDSSTPAGKRSTIAWGLAAAALSACAAAIHFAYAPDHFDEVASHGWFFVAAGAAQVCFALLVLTRPRRSVWMFGAVVNAIVFGTWAVTRLNGSEEMGWPDTIVSVAELLIVVLSIIALRKAESLNVAVPQRKARVINSSFAVVVLVFALLSGVMMTPEYVSGHSHGTDHADDHGTTEVALSPCELSGAPASEGQLSTDDSGHSHRGPALQEPLTREERILLEEQQAKARQVAVKYPNVAAAVADGYRMSTTYVPCIGAHYTKPILALRFDPGAPSELLFDGTTPDAKIVGLSYLVYSPTEPEGFAGPNDRWHRHNANGGLCMKGGVVVGGEAMSVEDCTTRGGRKVANDNVWMVHNWIVPGWECSWGVFAGECPELGGRVGMSAWDAPVTAPPTVEGELASN